MYTFQVSTKKNKKYDVYKNGKYLLSFGSKTHQQYQDKIGYYKNLDHNDKVRRKNYYKRFGKSAKKDTAKWFSHNYLW